MNRRIARKVLMRSGLSVIDGGDPVHRKSTLEAAAIKTRNKTFASFMCHMYFDTAKVMLDRWVAAGERMSKKVTALYGQTPSGK